MCRLGIGLGLVLLLVLRYIQQFTAYIVSFTYIDLVDCYGDFSYTTYYSGVFNCKFQSPFDRKPNLISPLGIRIQPQLQAVGFSRKDTLQYSIPSTPPWLLHRPQINYSLHSIHKDDTAPEIFGHNFNELCADYNQFTHLYTDGSKIGDRVAPAVVWQKSCKTVRLPNNASIFRAELYAIHRRRLHRGSGKIARYPQNNRGKSVVLFVIKCLYYQFITSCAIAFSPLLSL